MNRLARIFFKMCTRDANSFVLAPIVLDHELAVVNDRQLILTDLIALGQVGIKIILPGKDTT